jgi:formate hydrogenlyase transcriptional activator
MNEANGSTGAATEHPRTENPLPMAPPSGNGRQIARKLQIRQPGPEPDAGELRWIGTAPLSSGDRYFTLFDQAPVGYVTFDPCGIITGINPAAARMLGSEQDLLLNTPFSDCIAGKGGREIFANHLTWVFQKQCPLRCEIELARRGGSPVCGQLQSVALHLSDGSAAGVLTAIVDITVRKQLEESLLRSHAGLELRLKERSEELARANRQLAREMEERTGAEHALHQAHAEIRELKERFQAENIYLHQEIDREHNFGEIIGDSAAIKYVFFKIEQVAPQDTTVLLLGETGTGKGVVAHAIHGRSSRRDRPLVTVNCTSLPSNLIESELFGREKGAFTGSTIRQMGRFELADGGTIFLDEIGDMPLELQTKLLRVIQDGEFERLGSPRTIKVNVRIIAASNRNLEEEIRSGRFREDVFYRLNVFPITIPPLRKRKEDIPLLVNFFVAKFNKKTGKKIETVSKATLNILQAYHWPGNVRELESVIERAVITSQGSLLQVLDRFEAAPSATEEVRDIKALGDLERDHIVQVLRKTGWRIEGEHGAARLLGLNSSTLRGRMRKFGITRQHMHDA